MIGNNSNNQKGQVLLITVMLLSTVISIVIATSFHSTTEIQITKLEEEERRAFSAAEAAVEKALKEGQVTDIGSLPGLTGFSGSATIEQIPSPNFITPLLQKDEQYNLYLSTPQEIAPGNFNFNQLTPYYNNLPLTICLTNANIGLEITLIKNSSPFVVRYVINNNIVINAIPFNNNGTCPSGETFVARHQLNSSEIGSNNLLLIIRIIGDSSKVGFRGSANLPAQGKTIRSEVTSPGGSTKKIVLFQSYPQIPSEFFITSF